MRWIRLHIRPGAWLALTALAIHFVLTFGHVHAEQFSPVPMGTASIAVTSQAGDRPGSADAPQPYRPFLSHDHLCAVCASISLLGASVLPDVQMLALPCAVIAARALDILCRAAPRSQLRSAARARAPPSA